MCKSITSRDGSFSFFKTRSFRYENDDEKSKTKRSFFNENRFKKRSFSKTIIFKKLVVSLTIVSDKPLLTIVNEERRREEYDLKGIGIYH